MHHVNLPAGSTMRLAATARQDSGDHRWAMQLFTAADAIGAAPRAQFGSHIGGRDREQRIDVPAQDQDCRVEVTCRHAVPGDWRDDQASVDDATPGRLVIGYCDASAPLAQTDDVMLSFTFEAKRPV